MTVSYQIMGDLVIFTAKDSVQIKDFRGAFEKVISDPRFQKGSKILAYDLDSAFDPSTADPKESARSMSSFMSHFSPRVAVVVTKEASIGLGTLIQKYCEEYGIAFQVFRDPNRAKEWLYPSGS